MTWNPAGKRELNEELAKAGVVATDVGIDLAVRALEIRVGHHRGAAVPRSRHVNHVEIEFLDDPVQVHVDEVLPRRRAPVSEQHVLYVRQNERALQQWVVVKINLAYRQIVRGTPVGVHSTKQVGRERGYLHGWVIPRLAAGGRALLDSATCVPLLIGSRCWYTLDLRGRGHRSGRLPFRQAMPRVSQIAKTRRAGTPASRASRAPRRMKRDYGVAPGSSRLSCSTASSTKRCTEASATRWPIAASSTLPARPRGGVYSPSSSSCVSVDVSGHTESWARITGNSVGAPTASHPMSTRVTGVSPASPSSSRIPRR